SLKVSIEQSKSEADRLRFQEQQKALELEMERSARQSALAKADAATRQAAEEARKREEAERNADMAKSDAERIRRERDEARARLHAALNSIVETRITVRGLILNLPDILFDVDRATLKPQAKETLSKICGILQVAGESNLSIEGHTDSTGSEEHNQQLSERRAKAVRDYLVMCGLHAGNLTSKGFGKLQPLVSNDTAIGRQKNR